MTIYIDDTFTEASNTAITGHTPEIGGAWVHDEGSGGTVMGGLGYLNLDNTLTRAIRNTATPGSNVQRIDFDFLSPSGGGYVVSAWLRKTAGALTGYQLFFHESSGLSIRRGNAGSYTTLYSLAVYPQVNANYTGYFSISADHALTLYLYNVTAASIVASTTTAVDASPITQVGVNAIGSRAVRWYGVTATDDIATAPTISTQPPQMTGGFFDLTGGTS